jgi:hypothetical protein
MLKDKLVLRNLLTMILIDLFTSFNVYLVLVYLKYIGGNVFLNNIYLCIGNNIALMTSGMI